jgi:hypothetical protein
MSIIFDALRRGRARHTSKPAARAAQTDAVLQTLGYGRFSARSPAPRSKRLLGRVVAGVALAVVLWAAVAWFSH